MRKETDGLLAMSSPSPSELILNRLAEADPKGIEKEKFRRWAKKNGISEAELEDALRPFLAYANIYDSGESVRTHYSNCPVFHFMISIKKK